MADHDHSCLTENYIAPPPVKTNMTEAPSMERKNKINSLAATAASSPPGCQRHTTQLAPGCEAAELSSTNSLLDIPSNSTSTFIP